MKDKALAKECVQDWRKLKLSDYSAMIVMAIIFDPAPITEADRNRALEIMAKHPEWEGKLSAAPKASTKEGA